MNYHSTEWILNKLGEHHLEATTCVPETHIVGTFLQGSQNYGLDLKGSDVDTKCIVTPTFKDIALARKPLSTTHIRQNDEHIDLKDIRLYMQTFRKQNLNFLEILFTPYYIMGPNLVYTTQWQRLVDRREDITHYDPVRSVKSMMGIASEKYYAMEHEYPSRKMWLDQFGYDPKQLHHLLRVEEYLDRYLAGESYADCLVSKQPVYLQEIKIGYYTLDQARDVANKAYSHIHEVCDNFVEKHKDDSVSKEIDELLDDVAYEIMKASVQRDLWDAKGVPSFD